MTQATTPASDQLGPGEIRFVHYFLPELAAGEYRIEVDQEVHPERAASEYPFEAELEEQPEGATTSTPKTFHREQHFHVQGPRFGLAPTDVHAAYPPANSAGHYDDTLAHVVLRRRGLPWEIDLYGDNSTRPRPVPWMALLVFHPDEAPVVQTGRRSALLAGTLASSPRVPNLQVTEVDGDPLVTVVDIDATTFRSVIPHRVDLPWLAHVRQVRTDGKELLGMADDGWFSVVIANRLPVAGENTVHLVSLEGWAPQTTDSTNRQGKKPFRMISLMSWSFTSKSSRGSFDDRIRALDTGLLRANRTAPPPDQSEAANVVEAAGIVGAAVDSGFVPLRYDMRHGEESVAWYRGPMSPVAVPRTTDRGPLPSAEAGLVYHDHFGMFDVSYAVAWQIGRLLALSDSKFALELMRWRQLGQSRIDRLLAQEEALERHGRLAVFSEIGTLHERVRVWRELVAAQVGEDVEIEGDPEDVGIETERESLAIALRSLVLKIWDPDAIATEVAAFATNDILARLVDDDILPAAIDGKARLHGGAT